jgi:DNA-directed RNA polymerase specialized sigma24 family protein
MTTTARIEPPASVSERDAATFEAVRPRLFGVARRIVGGAAEAEDVVQDTWIRWHGTDRRGIRNAAAFLTTAATRLAINVTDSARVRHEAAGDAWLPEPIDLSADPTVGVERDEALALAVHGCWRRSPPQNAPSSCSARRLTIPAGGSPTSSRSRRPTLANCSSARAPGSAASAVCR